MDKNKENNRIFIIQLIISILFFITIIRVFFIQVIDGNKYKKIVNDLVKDTKIIEAERGEILSRDGGKLATNITLDLIYVDPSETANKRLVADELAKILYTNQDYEECLENYKLCPEGSIKISMDDIGLDDNINIDIEQYIEMPNKKEATSAYADQIFKKINKEYVDFFVLKREATSVEMQQIESLGINGLGVNKKNGTIYIDPTTKEIQKNKNLIDKVAKIIKVERKDIEGKFKIKKIRYVMIKRKISTQESQMIKEKKEFYNKQYKDDFYRINSQKLKEKVMPDFFKGVVLIPERWRYYPEKELLSHVLGYIDYEKNPHYGLEEKLDHELSGKNGIVETDIDILKRQISPNKITNPESGTSIVLTIDRSLQKEVDKILKDAVEKFNPDSGQIIVVNPNNGEILALSSYPNFDPNNFSKALTITRTSPRNSKNIYKTTPIFKKDENERFVVATYDEFKQKWKEMFNPEFYIYKYGLGAGNYVNRTVQSLYEPGSVFKPIAMAIGLEAKEVTPNTICNEDGPVKIGNHTINTATKTYQGLISMNDALASSSNPCMIEKVAFPLGKSIMYDYIVEKFRFSYYTNISLAEELSGYVRPKKYWSDADLATSSYGQGLTTTPMQVIRAWSALANGGMIIQPKIVLKKIKNGKEEKTNTVKIGRAISKETSKEITSMLVYSVDNGVASAGYIDGYEVAGKTGSSQIADNETGKYEKGEGAVITTFAGYAPAFDPEFLVLVKFDRPRYGNWDNTWGSNTAAPTFKKVMTLLLEKYNIPKTR